MTTVESAGVGDQRLPQAGIGRQVQGREGVVEEVDLRFADQGPGDGQPLTLAAGDVGASLQRSGPPARRAWPATKSAAWATVSASHISLLGGVGLAVTQVAGHRAREQVGLLGHQARLAGTGQVGEVANVHPVDIDGPAVTSTRRAIRLISVVFPAPVLPTTAVVCPLESPEGDVVPAPGRWLLDSGTRRA